MPGSSQAQSRGKGTKTAPGRESQIWSQDELRILNFQLRTMQKSLNFSSSIQSWSYGTGNWAAVPLLKKSQSHFSESFFSHFSPWKPTGKGEILDSIALRQRSHNMDKTEQWEFLHCCNLCFSTQCKIKPMELSGLGLFWCAAWCDLPLNIDSFLQ